MAVPNPDVLDVVIPRKVDIYYHDVSEWSRTEVPFLVANSDKGIIKGLMFDPRPGVSYRLYGHWARDKKRGTDCFEFYSHDILFERSAEGVKDYIRRFLPGFGGARAAQLLFKYGVEAIDALQADPSIALDFGLSPRQVDEVHKHFTETGSVDPHAYAAVYGLLADFHPPRASVLAVVEDYKSDAFAAIKANPYRLLNYPGLGWKTVDRVALEKVGYQKFGVERYKAGTLEALHRSSANGDTYMRRLELEGAVQELCGVGGPFDAALDALAAEGLVEVERHDGRDIVAEARLGAAEREVARRIAALVKADTQPLTFDPSDLEGEQVPAASFLGRHPVTLMVGAPGTGKTWTAVHVISQLNDAGVTVTAATPTGKAAKRVSEVLWDVVDDGYATQVTTIHKALGARGGGSSKGKFGRDEKSFRFTRGEGNPFETPVGFIDEFSMVDVNLMASYLRAVRPGSRLMLVGDPYQLPSVGPGAVLRDMVDGGVPCVRLDTPRRNSGRIVLACHAIKDGRPPEPNPTAGVDYDAGDNWIHLEEHDPGKIAQMIVQLHTETARDPLWDLQVISPQNGRLPIACANLNALLARHFNPEHHKAVAAAADDDKGPKYAPGDKVIRLRNSAVHRLCEHEGELDEGPDDGDDWGVGPGKVEQVPFGGRSYLLGETRVVNGDMGQVVDLLTYRGRKYVAVRFFNPDRLTMLPAAEPEIGLAYAITCHKALGSGWPVVIVPVHNSFYWDDRRGDGLWCRELLYSMFSRAEQCLITVGQGDAIAKAVSRKTMSKRKTRLARFLRESLDAGHHADD
jgi:exodeoxyribonuclease V alpha subunit